ncbi:hypothetical protein [Lactobacillus gasseri]|uniref:hypothetical protein n=1 Tax=Lactobacillus gasseri TaxID=1596 RepID=UPI003B6770F9
MLLDLIKALPYMVGILTAIIADRHWLYSELKADKKEYEEKYQAKEAEVEKLKDQINQLKIKIIKLEASQRGAFFDGKEKK